MTALPSDQPPFYFLATRRLADVNKKQGSSMAKKRTKADNNNNNNIILDLYNAFQWTDDEV